MTERKYGGELKPATADIFAGAVFLAVSLLLWFYLIPYTISVRPNTRLDISNNPTIFPRLFTVILAVLAVILIIQGLRKYGKNRDLVCGGNIRADIVSLLLIDSPALLVFALVSVIFCLIAPALGFFSSGFLLVVVSAWYLGNRGIVWLVLFPAVMTALVWVVFDILLQVRFPSGVLF